MIEHVETHEAEALAHLIEVFKRSENLRDMISILVEPLQELEDVFHDILEKRILANATDAQLDGLGELVGEACEGREASVYQEAIRIRILINKCSGTPEEIIAILLATFCNEQTITADPPVIYQSMYPAGFIVYLVNYLAGNWNEFPMRRYQNVLRDITGAGIGSQIWVHPAGAFRFDLGPGYDVGKYGGAII